MSGNMKERNKKDDILICESERIWQMKAVAILFVVCAHCAGVLDTATIYSTHISLFMQSLGSLGVPVFFMLSGYLFKYKPFKVWWRAKIMNLVLPWLFCGAIVYIYMCIRKGGFSLIGLVKWCVGYNTYLWFMTVTLVMIVLAECISYLCTVFNCKEEFVWGTWILVCILFLFLERYRIIVMLPYLNPFRWGWIFGLGVLLKKHISIGSLPVFPYSVLLGIIMVCWGTWKFGIITYWSRAWWCFALMVIVCALPFYVSRFYIGKIISQIGKRSFSIYLLHMPIAGAVANLLNCISDPIGISVIIRPIIVIAITYAGILVMLRAVDVFIKIEKISRILRLLIGVR